MNKPINLSVVALKREIFNKVEIYCSKKGLIKYRFVSDVLNEFFEKPEVKKVLKDDSKEEGKFYKSIGGHKNASKISKD